MPIACAASTSAAMSSPTMTASAASAFARRSASTNIAGAGLPTIVAVAPVARSSAATNVPPSRQSPSAVSHSRGTVHADERRAAEHGPSRDVQMLPRERRAARSDHDDVDRLTGRDEVDAGEVVERTVVEHEAAGTGMGPSR